MRFDMEQITIRIPENTLEDLEDEAEDAGRTRSEHIRDALNHRNEHTEHECIPLEEYRELERELARREQDVSRLQEEKRKILDNQKEKRELQAYVAKDKEWHEADLFTRLKWYLRGKE